MRRNSWHEYGYICFKILTASTIFLLVIRVMSMNRLEDSRSDDFLIPTSSPTHSKQAQTPAPIVKNLPQEPSFSEHTPGTYITPREFARSCCDFAMKSFSSSSKFHMEAGYMDYPQVLSEMSSYHRDIITVYIASANTLEFFEEIVFKLPETKQIVLVTGQEDIGPCNLWNLSTRPFRGPPATFSFEKALSSSRLRHWFAQNYNLVPNHDECTRDIDASYLAKIEPFPIGLDFHTLDEKERVESRRISVAKQEQMIDSLKNKKKWSEKSDQIIFAFIADNRKFDRSIAYQARSRFSNCIRKPAFRTSRDELWGWHTTAKFSACPKGIGIDTHRLYEALALHTVPVVSSSPLDRLYKEMPIIIVDSWEAARGCDDLTKWSEDIVRRFGPDPFANFSGVEISYWKSRIEAYAKI